MRGKHRRDDFREAMAHGSGKASLGLTMLDLQYANFSSVRSSLPGRLDRFKAFPEFLFYDR
jgi:hypothetical protein